MMPLSLGEVEALALKAARGAGLEWGMAEEAAFATRWLVEQGIDGLAVLAAHLNRLAAGPGVPLAVVIGGDAWASADASPLCPIALGTALSDHFDLPDGPATRIIRLTPVMTPSLLLPFLARAAARNGGVVVVEWAGTRVVLHDRVILALAGAETVMADVRPVVVVTGTPKRGAPIGTPPRATLSTVTAQILNRLELRTYVPASPQSRRDAGAAEMDNL